MAKACAEHGVEPVGAAVEDVVKDGGGWREGRREGGLMENGREDGRVGESWSDEGRDGRCRTTLKEGEIGRAHV